ncbi:ATP-dependent RNA helicase DDX24 [Trichinella papuae]|uniref:RNA helicase n=1 Tax=Trichinella papuae TaxID=268474 RepID=A0A0V1MZ78_9BILA|nr:ATP-dependent RNA helicase DDX24 [Trichinella papuae]KRZ76970.1 ATP-dependent RNA helicase DDX24 [Trichinella papuae]
MKTKKKKSNLPPEISIKPTDETFDFLSDFEEITDYTCLKSTAIYDNKNTSKKRKLKNKQNHAIINKQEASAKKSKLESFESVSENYVPGKKLKKWQELFVPEEILHALDDLQYFEPTPIQALCLPPAIRDRLDILGAAETGSGKTLAFGIPVIAGLLSENSDSQIHPSALILTPTRELAIQIKDHLSSIMKYTNLKLTTATGGLSIQKQQRLLKNDPDIVIATPGRLWALISEDCEGLENLHKIKYLVIDEIDRMAEKQNFSEFSQLLEFLNGDENAIRKRQTLVFSATLSFVHPMPNRLLSKANAKPLSPEEKIENLISFLSMREKRKVIDLSSKHGLSSSLVESCLFCSTLEMKDTSLYYFLRHYPGRTLIFANSVNCVRRLKNLLTLLKFKVYFLHADVNQKKRLSNLENFTNNDDTILVATDVAARGLDIKNVQHVVHYQVPRTAETYIHRSGRTARLNQRGLSLMLVDKQDVNNFRRVSKTLKRGKELPVFPVDFELMKFYSKLVRITSELESLEHRRKGVSAEKNWFQKAAKETDIILDEDVLQNDAREENERNVKSRIDHLKRQLSAHLDELNRNVKTLSKYPSFNMKSAANDDATTIYLPESAVDAALVNVDLKKPKFAYTTNEQPTVILYKLKKNLRKGKRKLKKKAKSKRRK